jgi:flagellar secretion chaperone FliS
MKPVALFAKDRGMAAPTHEYLKTKVMTASPELLTLMLWDGAIRFAEQGKIAIIEKDIEGSYKTLLRSQRIITELTANLKHDVDPDLCGKLAALYNFIYRRLVDANVTKNPQLVDDALEIMRHQRETWVMLMEKLTRERAGEAQATVVANADAISNAPATAATSSGTPLPVTHRRAYPAFAVRPVPVGAGISVEG